MHAFTHAVDTLIWQCTPAYTHTSSPSYTLTTLTFSHTFTHPTSSHTIAYTHTPPHTTHTDGWSSIERGSLLVIIVDHPLPDGLFVSVSVTLSVSLSGIVSALHFYSGGSSSAGSCFEGVAGIMSVCSCTFQQSIPWWGSMAHCCMNEGQNWSRLFAGREWSFLLTFWEMFR